MKALRPGTAQRSVRRGLLIGFGLLPRQVRRRGVRLGTPNFTVGSVMVITDSAGRVLLLRQRHYRHGLGLPGGLLKGGEPPAEGLQRELAEELGLRTDVEVPSAVAVDAERRRVDLIFAARFVGDPTEPRPDDQEVIEVCWRSPVECAEVGPATQGVLDALARAQLGTAGSAWPGGGKPWPPT